MDIIKHVKQKFKDEKFKDNAKIALELILTGALCTHLILNRCGALPKEKMDNRENHERIEDMLESQEKGFELESIKATKYQDDYNLYCYDYFDNDTKQNMKVKFCYKISEEFYNKLLNYASQQENAETGIGISKSYVMLNEFTEISFLSEALSNESNNAILGEIYSAIKEQNPTFAFGPNPNKAIENDFLK